MMFLASRLAEFVATLYATTLRASIAVTLCVALLWALRRSSAGIRSLVTTTGLFFTLLMPIPRAFPFGWAAPVLPGPVATPLVEVGTVHYAAQFLTAGGSLHDLADRDGFIRGISIVGAIFAIWLLGAMVMLARIGAAWIAVRAIAKRASYESDPGWDAVVAEARQRFGIRRPVDIAFDPVCVVPLTWRTWRPLLILPVAARDWPVAYRRAVSFHEMAHVRARDSLSRMLAGMACAVFWFHPAVWWLLRRHGAERELACDDAAMLQGVDAADYAECLLTLKEDVHQRGFARSLVAPSAADSSLLTRVRSVLAPRRPRRMAGRFASYAAAAMLSLGVITVGSARLAPTPSESLRHLTDWRWERRAHVVRVLTRSIFLSGRHREGIAMLVQLAAHDPHPRVRQRARDAVALLADAPGRVPARIPALPP
jgi:beta-lactamase regulating signal transducer with metallopeptidase domain